MAHRPTALNPLHVVLACLMSGVCGFATVGMLVGGHLSGMTAFFASVSLASGLWAGLTVYTSRKRTAAWLDYLESRYDAKTMVAIECETFWQGMTSGMLQDSLGQPARVDETVLKTKIKQTWCYQPRPRGYGLKVFLEDGLVVGWDQKGG